MFWCLWRKFLRNNNVFGMEFDYDDGMFRDRYLGVCKFG